MKHKSKELETLIIGNCLSEDQYNKCSFLVPDDFHDWADLPAQLIWAVMKKYKGRYYDIIREPKIFEIKNSIWYYAHIGTYKDVTIMALRLSEIRFKELLADVIGKALGKTKSSSEGEILMDVFNEVNEEGSDIFRINEHILEYLDTFSSDETKNLINRYLDYVKKREQEIQSFYREQNKGQRQVS